MVGGSADLAVVPDGNECQRQLRNAACEAGQRAYCVALQFGVQEKLDAG